MLSTDDDQTTGKTSSNEFERRLWFDYLRELNDRALQASSRSGATNWVLIGAAAAVIYKCAPQLPKLFAVPDLVRANLVIFLLQVDSVVLYLGAGAYLALYVSAWQVQTRVKPEASRRLQSVMSWIAFALLTTTTILHFPVALSIRSTHAVSITLAVWGFFWVWNLQSAFRKAFQSRRKARQLGKPLPQFHGLIFDNNRTSLIAVIICVGIGAPGTIVELLYLKELANTPIGWLTPLASATYLLTLLIVLFVLVYRLLQVQPQATYQELEQAILLEQLNSGEIRARFIGAILGPKAEEWLKDIDRNIDEAEARLHDHAESIRRQLVEVEAIDATYVLERRGRAEKLLHDLKTATAEFSATLNQYIIQLKEYARSYKAPEEAKLFRAITDERKTKLQATLVSAGATGALSRRLSELSRE